MANTNARKVIDSFESSFADKQVLPESLEMQWLMKAVGRYNAELTPLYFDDEILEFDHKLNQYTIDTLAEFMKQMYMERQLSIVNKRINIVGKDLSISEGANSKKYTLEELDRVRENSRDMVENQKLAAYV